MSGSVEAPEDDSASSASRAPDVTVLVGGAKMVAPEDDSASSAPDVTVLEGAA